MMKKSKRGKPFYFGVVQATYANNIGCNALSGLTAAKLSEEPSAPAFR